MGVEKNYTNKSFHEIDNLFCEIDRSFIRRTKNLRLIPDFLHRIGGRRSYAEWAHVIGIFQTLIYQNIKKKDGNKILDVGCGSGILGISSEPFICDGGRYTGIDVNKNDIDFCIKHFDACNYSFCHLNVANGLYAPMQNETLIPWPIEKESQDLVTALSLWTHLNENDARFYFNEIQRVLNIGSKAIITFFYLDELYFKSLRNKENGMGKFNCTDQSRWVFDKNIDDSSNWFSRNGANLPENAIGISHEGIDSLIKNSGLKLINYYPGNWKEIPSVYFQDILIFEKA